MKWTFHSSREVDGINNPIISHFTGNPYYHLAREVIQNSLDAKLNNTKPVEVTFTERLIPIGEIPGIDQFSSILHSCKEFWHGGFPDCHEFLDNAIEQINEKEIPFLICTDNNTKGLSGDDNDLNSDWFGLVRSKGTSPKGPDTGGSFGIGKGAPFTVSTLRTVYYYSRSEKGITRFQGKSMIVSHKNDQNETTNGTGFFGRENADSIDMYDQIPGVFRRKNIYPGLDIYVAGFRNILTWQTDLIQSILRNFWYSIYSKELKVKVGNDRIAKDNLEDNLVKYFQGEELKDHIEPKGNPLQYYKSVISGELLEYDHSELGEIKFHFKEIDSHMNYVAMMRKPHMIVLSKPFRFPGKFCGVLICDNSKGNKILRKMEPPTHNRWEGESYGINGKKILDELYEKIRSVLKEKQNIKSKGKLEIPDLYKYLPFDLNEEEADNSNNGGREKNKESQNESASMVQKQEAFNHHVEINPYKVSVLNEVEQVGIGGGKSRNTNKKKSSRKGIGIGKDSGKIKSRTMKGILITPIIKNRTSKGYEYLLKIKSDSTRNCSVRIQAQGESVKAKVNLLRAWNEDGNNILVSGNKMNKVILYEHGTNLIHCEIESKSKLALNISLDEIQK